MEEAWELAVVSDDETNTIKEKKPSTLKPKSKFRFVVDLATICAIPLAIYSLYQSDKSLKQSRDAHEIATLNLSELNFPAWKISTSNGSLYFAELDGSTAVKNVSVYLPETIDGEFRLLKKELYLANRTLALKDLYPLRGHVQKALLPESNICSDTNRILSDLEIPIIVATEYMLGEKIQSITSLYSARVQMILSPKEIPLDECAMDINAVESFGFVDMNLIDHLKVNDLNETEKYDLVFSSVEKIWNDNIDKRTNLIIVNRQLELCSFNCTNDFFAPKRITK